jgi:hypothetical protein
LRVYGLMDSILFAATSEFVREPFPAWSDLAAHLAAIGSEGSYLREPLKEWSDLRLDLIEINRPDTGERFKQVWRGIAPR